MIKLEMELSDIDYEVLVKEILPKVADRLKQNGSPLAPLLSGTLEKLAADNGIPCKVQGLRATAAQK